MSGIVDDREALAAEYALGILDREERRRAQHLMEQDRSFERLVELWQGRLVSLADTVSEVEPPDALWSGIEATLGPQHETAAMPKATSEPERVGVPLLQSLFFWRGLTAGAVAFATVLLAYVVSLDRGSPDVDPGASERLVAVLSAGESRPALIATVDQANYRVMVRPIAAEPTSNQTLELWLVVDDDLPHSLGLLDPTGSTSLQIAPQLERMVGGSTRLVVSMEPEGGSPTGRPTGPVIYQGPLLALNE